MNSNVRTARVGNGERDVLACGQVGNIAAKCYLKRKKLRVGNASCHGDAIDRVTADSCARLIR